MQYDGDLWEPLNQRGQQPGGFLVCEVFQSATRWELLFHFDIDQIPAEEHHLALPLVKSYRLALVDALGRYKYNGRWLDQYHDGEIRQTFYEMDRKVGLFISRVDDQGELINLRSLRFQPERVSGAETAT